jgi:hypothetical protein
MIGLMTLLLAWIKMVQIASMVLSSRKVLLVEVAIAVREQWRSMIQVDHRNAERVLLPPSRVANRVAAVATTATIQSKQADINEVDVPLDAAARSRHQMKAVSKSCHPGSMRTVEGYHSLAKIHLLIALRICCGIIWAVLAEIAVVLGEEEMKMLEGGDDDDDDELALAWSLI